MPPKDTDTPSEERDEEQEEHAPSPGAAASSASLEAHLQHHFDALRQAADERAVSWNEEIPAAKYVQLAVTLENAVQVHFAEGFHEDTFVKALQYLQLFKLLKEHVDGAGRKLLPNATRILDLAESAKSQISQRFEAIESWCVGGGGVEVENNVENKDQDESTACTETEELEANKSKDAGVVGAEKEPDDAVADKKEPESKDKPEPSRGQTAANGEEKDETPENECTKSTEVVDDAPMRLEDLFLLADDENFEDEEAPTNTSPTTEGATENESLVLPSKTNNVAPDAAADKDTGKESNAKAASDHLLRTESAALDAADDPLSENKVLEVEEASPQMRVELEPAASSPDLSVEDVTVSRVPEDFDATGLSFFCPTIEEDNRFQSIDPRRPGFCDCYFAGPFLIPQGKNAACENEEEDEPEVVPSIVPASGAMGDQEDENQARFQLGGYDGDSLKISAGCSPGVGDKPEEFSSLDTTADFDEDVPLVEVPALDKDTQKQTTSDAAASSAPCAPFYNFAVAALPKDEEAPAPPLQEIEDVAFPAASFPSTGSVYASLLDGLRAGNGRGLDGFSSSIASGAFSAQDGLEGLEGPDNVAPDRDPFSQQCSVVGTLSAYAAFDQEDKTLFPSLEVSSAKPFAQGGTGAHSFSTEIPMDAECESSVAFPSMEKDPCRSFSQDDATGDRRQWRPAATTRQCGSDIYPAFEAVSLVEQTFLPPRGRLETTSGNRTYQNDFQHDAVKVPSKNTGGSGPEGTTRNLDLPTTCVKTTIISTHQERTDEDQLHDSASTMASSSASASLSSSTQTTDGEDTITAEEGDHTAKIELETSETSSASRGRTFADARTRAKQVTFSTKPPDVREFSPEGVMRKLVEVRAPPASRAATSACSTKNAQEEQTDGDRDTRQTTAGRGTKSVVTLQRKTFECNQRSLQVDLPFDLVEAFVKIAKANTTRNVETCGWLCGRKLLNEKKIMLDYVLLPPQKGDDVSCEAVDELPVVQWQLQQKNCLTFGWIHTHPRHNCFLSAVDLHQQCSFQLQEPLSIAIVFSPIDSKQKALQGAGVFRLTEYGVKFIQKCPLRGFHPHDGAKHPLYEAARNVTVNRGRRVKLIDFRTKPEGTMFCLGSRGAANSTQSKRKNGRTS
ncbi:unnamed protein product [Amoebophrya sp. A120]|nr:unnamed protein product [Amoebophrya sp. A120]|eukprot:GSA120T00011337001.1